MARARFGWILGTLVAAAAAAGLGEKRPEPVLPVPPRVFVLGHVVTVDRAGGKLALGGASLVVPEGALAEPARIALAEVPLPGPLARGARAASPVLSLTKTLPGRFAKPVLVTLPISSTRIDDVVACYWDDEFRMYRTLTVTERTARTITFETVHFTEFVALEATPDEALSELDTGFRPERDGFGYENGDYDSNGTCLGMSLMSAWYFESHRNDGVAPLASVLAALHPISPQADLTGREMGLLAQDEAIPNGTPDKLSRFSRAALEEAKARGPVASGLALHAALRTTGTPQIVVLRGPFGCHAVVAYGYQDGKFLLYDPNYPRDVKTIAFDRENGFHDSTATPLGSPVEVAPISFSSYADDVDFKKVFEQSLRDRGPAGRYTNVLVEDVAFTQTSISVSGKVAGGLEHPKDPVYSVQLVVGTRSLATSYLSMGQFTLIVTPQDLAEAVASERASPVVIAGRSESFAGASPVSVSPGLVGALLQQDGLAH